MDHLDVQHIQGNDSGSSGVDFPQSQELFSDQEYTEHDTEEDRVIIPHEAHTSSHNDNSNLFEDQFVCTPKRTQRTRGCKKLTSPPIQNTDSDESSDYEPPPRKLTLKEIFDNHFRKERKKKTTKKKTKKKRPQKVDKKRKTLLLHSFGTKKKKIASLWN
ncbi:unnamed protein product [Staurois parvus]|uniref:Uncharacterized protein n=1 Tax=Staurois parvus TaxID=386267 RepID=A0ABN9HJE1_9NEOB|nr:unnamed protein product [Staurois parvus]